MNIFVDVLHKKVGKIFVYKTGHNSGGICMTNIPWIFRENVQWQYFENGFWGNNKFGWVVRNMMPQMKRFKSTRGGLVIP